MYGLTFSWIIGENWSLLSWGSTEKTKDVHGSPHVICNSTFSAKESINENPCIFRLNLLIYSWSVTHHRKYLYAAETSSIWTLPKLKLNELYLCLSGPTFIDLVLFSSLALWPGQRQNTSNRILIVFFSYCSFVALPLSFRNYSSSFQTETKALSRFVYFLCYSCCIFY